MAYKCCECENIFEEAERISSESFYGVSNLFGNSCSSHRTCPYCGSDQFEEVDERGLTNKQVFKLETILEELVSLGILKDEDAEKIMESTEDEEYSKIYKKLIAMY